MHLSSASPRGGPRADVGEYGDFMHLSLETPTPDPNPGETWGIRGDLQVLR